MCTYVMYVMYVMYESAMLLIGGCEKVCIGLNGGGGVRSALFGCLPSIPRPRPRPRLSPDVQGFDDDKFKKVLKIKEERGARVGR